jgi:hypothetical protein
VGCPLGSQKRGSEGFRQSEWYRLAPALRQGTEQGPKWAGQPGEAGPDPGVEAFGPGKVRHQGRRVEAFLFGERHLVLQRGFR